MASDDIAHVTELLDAATRADGRRPLSDHLYLDLVNGGLDGFTGFLASEPGHDHPVAYAQISRGNDAYAFELVIHPHHRYEMATIGPELIESALDVVASDGGGQVNWWVFEPTSAHRKLAADADMVPGRSLLPDAPIAAHRSRRDASRRGRSSPATTTRRGCRSTIERSPPTASRAAGRSRRSVNDSRKRGSTRRGSECTTSTDGWRRSAGPRSTSRPHRATR